MQYIALDDDNVQILPAPLITQQQQQTIPQAIPIAPIQQEQQILPSTSTVQGGSGLIQSLLPQYVAQSRGEARPKKINVLVQRSQHQGASSLRSSKAGPVPEELRIKDRPRFYCDQCPANFSIKSELNRHK